MCQENKRGKKKNRIIIRKSLHIVLLCTLLFPLFQMARKHPFPYYGTGLYTVVSGSMEPTIATGSLLVVRSIRETTIKEGNILTFRGEKGDVITHRVVRIETEGQGIAYITKGDANNTEDSPIDASRIIGKVLFWVPGVGLLTAYLKYPPVILWILVIFIVCVLLGKAFKKPKPQEKEQADQEDRV